MLTQRQQRLQLVFLLLQVVAAASATAAAAQPAAAPFIPPAADSTCSRSKHVVLASFGEPEEYHTVSLYFASQFPNASVHHLWLYSGDRGENKEKQSHKHKSPVDWRAFYRAHGIHRSVVDMASLEAYHKLRATYLHSSVNKYEYELLCFARFIGLHEFCSSKGIDQLTWIDADIPIFDPDFLDRVCLPRGYSIWALTSGSSFLNTMTCLEIGRFVDFMIDFYAKENRHALVRAIHAHGSTNMDDAKRISEKVRQAEPAFAELGIDPKHFSDMFLFIKYLHDMNDIAVKASRESKYGKHEETATSLSAAPQSPQELNKAYIEQDENGGTIDPYFVPLVNMRINVSSPDKERVCVNEVIWNQYFSLRNSDIAEDKWKPKTQVTKPARFGMSFNESGTWVPISGAHFQGEDCKARLVSTFSGEISKRA